MYEPGIWVSRVSPTPLLMVVARDDKLTVADLALAAYERALEPKRLALIPGGHYGRFAGRECCSDRASELIGELVWQRRTDETQEQFKRRVMADAPQRKWSNATVIVFW
jgi:fermentation-respiration switch protein FrsA (DUF1100 family)